MSLGPKVVDGVLLRESPSGIKTFEDCPAKWHHIFVQGMRDKPSPAAEVGIRAHERIERHLKTGEPTLSDPELAGRAWIPAPTEIHAARALVEPAIDKGNPIAVIAGVPLVGRLDLMLPRGPYIDPEGISHATSTPEVVDWKTSGDPRKWGKTADQLRGDLAMNAYAAWTRTKLHQPSMRVRVSHVYFSTKKRDAFKRTAIVTAYETASVFEATAPTIERIKHVAKLPIAEVEKNPDACGKYGGCPFSSICVRSPGDVLRSMFPGFEIPTFANKPKPKDLKVSLLDQLNETSAPAETPAAKPPNDMAARVAALQAQQAAITAPPKVDPRALITKIETYGLGSPVVGGELAKSLGADGYAGSGQLAGIGTVTTLQELVDLERGLAARVKTPPAQTAPAPKPEPAQTAPAAPSAPVPVAAPSPLSPPDAPVVAQADAAEPLPVETTLSLAPAVAARVAEVAATATPAPPVEEKPVKRGRPKGTKKPKLKLAEARARVEEQDIQIAELKAQIASMHNVADEAVANAMPGAPAGIELWVELSSDRRPSRIPRVVRDPGRHRDRQVRRRSEPANAVG